MSLSCGYICMYRCSFELVCAGVGMCECLLVCVSADIDVHVAICIYV